MRFPRAKAERETRCKERPEWGCHPYLRVGRRRSSGSRSRKFEWRGLVLLGSLLLYLGCKFGCCCRDSKRQYNKPKEVWVAVGNSSSACLTTPLPLGWRPCPQIPSRHVSASTFAMPSLLTHNMEVGHVTFVHFPLPITWSWDHTYLKRRLGNVAIILESYVLAKNQN